MTRRSVIRRAAALRISLGRADTAVPAAVARHLLSAVVLTALLIGGLLGCDDLEVGRLMRDTAEPFVPFVLLVTGFFGLISCGMFATAAAIVKTGE